LIEERLDEADEVALEIWLERLEIMDDGHVLASSAVNGEALRTLQVPLLK
jgi:hypothetical protein